MSRRTRRVTFTDLTKYYPEPKCPVHLIYIVGGLGPLLKSLQLESTHGLIFHRITYEALCNLDEEKLITKHRVHWLAAKKLINALKKVKDQELYLKKIKKEMSKDVTIDHQLLRLEKIIPDKNALIVGNASSLIVDILISIKPLLSLIYPPEKCEQYKSIFVRLCRTIEENICFDGRQTLKLKKLRLAIEILDVKKKTFPYLKRRSHSMKR